MASKADDARVVVSTLPAQAAAGENGRPDAYVQAPQGLFPAPMQQSKATGVLSSCQYETQALNSITPRRRLSPPGYLAITSGIAGLLLVLCVAASSTPQILNNCIWHCGFTFGMQSQILKRQGLGVISTGAIVNTWMKGYVKERGVSKEALRVVWVWL